MVQHQRWELGRAHQEKRPLVARKHVDRFDVRLTIPEASNRFFGVGGQSFPPFVFAAGLATRRTWKLGAQSGELVPELHVSKLRDRLRCCTQSFVRDSTPLVEALAESLESRPALLAGARAQYRQNRGDIVDLLDGHFSGAACR